MPIEGHTELLPPKPTINAAVEGMVDGAVASRLIADAGAIPGSIHGQKGKPHLLGKLDAYTNAAIFAPWLILVDMDRQFPCAPSAKAYWLARSSPKLCFRIVVQEIEAWLLADRVGLSKFLCVKTTSIPVNPESIADPKDALVNLARTSRSRHIRVDMVPRPQSGRVEGPAYASRLIEFIRDKWSPAEAATKSPSLNRAIKCLERLIQSFTMRGSS